MDLLFTPRLSWNLAKSKLATHAVKAYQKHFGHFSHSEHFKLFDSIIKPIVLYGAESCGTPLAVEIEQVQVLQRIPRSR